MELARPLYEAIKRSQEFQWTQAQQEAFESLKQSLLTAPALGLPDVTKPFHLYVDENKGIAKGILTQTLGPWRCPVAYLSKKLDPVSGWPPCLRICCSVALLIKDADKLTLGQNLTIAALHTLEGVLKQPPDRWLSNARMTHYQTLLLNPARITFQVPVALNPAALLPDPDLDTLMHDCTEILAQVHNICLDLKDTPCWMLK